jgi:Uncharacterized protein conserved in bacteria
MAKILGLDLGTNSIGWALVDNTSKQIIKAGSRIIPMDAKAMSDFESGTLQSSAAARTGFRGIRRLNERAELRRQRLLRVLNVLNFLPAHFQKQIDFDKHPGQFINHGEPLLPYRKDSNNKNEFIFMDSFKEMLEEFREIHPEMLAEGRKIPYDWTIYYLRKKALIQPIKREELAWILLNFNTKRGYYQLRGEEEDASASKNEEYKVLTVVNVEKLDAVKNRKGLYWYDITYDNGAKQRKTGIVDPRNIGDQVEVIVTTTLDKEGNIAFDKEGNPKIKLRDPQEGDWTLMKKRTEADLNNRNITVGEYIYDSILADPTIKVRGKLVKTIERKYYKEELIKILNKQCKFIPELSDSNIYEKCVRELYHNNEAHIQSLSQSSFTSFFVDDIIFYQRPLKSKKSEIANCPYEHYQFVNKNTGEIVKQPIKVIPKSHPIYQEFRLWQFISNLRVIQKEKNENGKLKTDVDVTDEFINTAEKRCKLYEQLNVRKDINNNQFVKLICKENASLYRWNYVEDAKTYPCNETRYLINRDNVLQSDEQCNRKEIELWHILYSVSDPILLRKALNTFATKNGLDVESFVENHIHIKPFNADYGAYSEKALKRLLPLMRIGKYWHEENINAKTRSKIDIIIAGEADDAIYDVAAKNHISLTSIDSFQGLPLFLTEMIVYGKRKEVGIWKSPDDITYYLKYDFKQHSLRNPVVETVLGETLRVVRDIWAKYGKIDEIHVEMGRNLKQSKDKRIKDMQRNSNNEHTNLRIRRLLQEFVNPDCEIDNVRPYSPSQMELFKIYETDVLNSNEPDDDILSIIKDLGDTTKHVSHQDIIKYRLWLEQRYTSPYTGDMIPLSKLFTPAYEIEHVIPQSRYFDDSLSNKVICESEVNKLKDNRLGYEFIVAEHGHIIGKHRVFDKVQYEEYVREHYANDRLKMKKLLMEDIPDSFIQKQLNDSRYIARKTIEILSSVVRITDESGEIADNDKAATAINVIATNGSITDHLKKDWGVNQVWNHIIAPRFERLNKITSTEQFGKWIEKNGERYFQTEVPIDLSPGFNKKRIDHRHHAMDAIVIACATRNHVNYLNNSAAIDNQKDLRMDLRSKLCFKDKTDGNGNYVWRLNKPWDSFTQDVESQLSSIIVSFKQNLRVINKMTNHYSHYVNGKKKIVSQNSTDSWAVRKSLHKATVSGAVRLQTQKKVSLKDALNTDWHLITDKEVRKAIKDIIAQYHKFDAKIILKYFKDRKNELNGKDISKVIVYYTPEVPELSASRIAIDDTFDEKKINAVTDSGIRNILLNHFKANDSDPKLAFSADGISRMNQNLKKLNGGKDHKPIIKVRKSETLGMKFSIGERGNKNKKYVEADKGTNLFFAIYADKDGNRSFESIPFNESLECMKNNLPVAKDINDKSEKLQFVLSPGDLVVVTDENGTVPNMENAKIYKMMSSSDKDCFFIPQSVAMPIVKTAELGSNNKSEKSWDGVAIKKNCFKLILDRLGNVEKIIKGNV